jgi:hypothetical protein
VLACRRDEMRGPAVLAALARLAPTDAHAASTLFQVPLPGLVSSGAVVAVDASAFHHEADILGDGDVG